MGKAVGNILKGIVLSVLSPIIAPFLAITQLVGSFTTFLG